MIHPLQNLRQMKSNKKQDGKIICIGLQGVGKSHLLQSLKSNQGYQINPTQGFNIVNIQTDSQTAQIYDFGGEKQFRELWDSESIKINSVLFIFDYQQEERRQENLQEINKILNSKQLKDIPIAFVNYSKNIKKDQHKNNSEYKKEILNYFQIDRIFQ